MIIVSEGFCLFWLFFFFNYYYYNFIHYCYYLFISIFCRSDYQQLVYSALSFKNIKIKLLKPCIYKPRQFWSGKQVKTSVYSKL